MPQRSLEGISHFSDNGYKSFHDCSLRKCNFLFLGKSLGSRENETIFVALRNLECYREWIVPSNELTSSFLISVRA